MAAGSGNLGVHASGGAIYEHARATILYRP
jgi:hypothetical protein